jgi:hypothetical protein
VKTVAVGPLAANLLADSIGPAGAIIAPLKFWFLTWRRRGLARVDQ